MVGAVALVVAWTVSCGHGPTTEQRHYIDSLNQEASSARYLDLDRLRALSTEALTAAEEIRFGQGRAEARNNLAFERFVAMDFDGASHLAASILDESQNQVECLVADVMLMKIAQRTSDNKGFYQHRNHALRRIHRIEEEENLLNSHLRSRFDYGRSEYHIVASTYYYYVDQQERSLEEIREAEPFCSLAQDTAQWLYYAYMRGSGGLSEETTAEEVTRQEFEDLFRCFTLARGRGFIFFEANAAQALASMIVDPEREDIVRQVRPDALEYLANIVPTENGNSLPAALATLAAARFAEYGDTYQEACTRRTMGEVSFAEGRYEDAVGYYEDALAMVQQTQTEQGIVAPEWVAGIQRNLSVAYSALDSTQASMSCRAAYLGLLEDLREDAELESRYAELQKDTYRLHIKLIVVGVMALVLVVLLVILRAVWIRKTRRRMQHKEAELQRHIEAADHERRTLEEQQEMLTEQHEVVRQRIVQDKAKNIEKRAKLQLVLGITPFIDRILYETKERKAMDGDYIQQLTQHIKAYNQLLTRWIQMQQGQLGLKISTFEVESVLAILRKSIPLMQQKGVTLHVLPSILKVKADKALTFFMLNTILDNARKFTERGGNITVEATEGDCAEGAYVELSVQDTGCGISSQPTEGDRRKGHGFGLMNCKGIIEKYRKTNDLFRVCSMDISSQSGVGTRVSFRLPRIGIALLALVWNTTVWAMPQDSTYTRWQQALDSLSAQVGTDTASHLVVGPSVEEPLEYLWWQHGEQADYERLLLVRNAIAEEALRLHDWDCYAYNDRIYTHLHKLLNQDTTLESYCDEMEQSRNNDSIAIVVIIILLLVIILVVIVFFVMPQRRFRRLTERMQSEEYKQTMHQREEERQQQMQQLELSGDEYARKVYEEERLHVQNMILDNCLSTIKHETLYYPDRIAQLTQQLEQDSDPATLQTLRETVAYYKEIFSILCAQAQEQADVLNFRRSLIGTETLADMMNHEMEARCRRHPCRWTLTNAAPQLSLLGDADLLRLLLHAMMDAEAELAERHGVGETMQYDVTIRAVEGQIRCTLTVLSVPLTDDEIQEIFMPQYGCIPLLIAKQIIREHDTFLNFPGCRINIEQAPDHTGHCFWFALPSR